VPAAPRAVSHLMGIDGSTARQLGLAREQVVRLGHEKARLVDTYERQLADVRAQMHEAQARVELQDRTSRERDESARAADRAAADEKATLTRSLRAALMRAEAAEVAASAANSDCAAAPSLLTAAKTTGAVVGAKVGHWARGAGESARSVSESMAKEASGMAKEAGHKLGQFKDVAPGLLSDVSAATRRLLADVTMSHREGEVQAHPVG